MVLLSRLNALGRALKNRDFAIYTAGNTISLIGTWIQRLATGWLTWELTKSGAWLGIVAFADLFPTIVVGPIAGAAADRWNRLNVTRTTQSLLLCQSAILFVLTATGHITISALVVLTAVGGVISAFNQPARLALVPSLVPRSDLVAAVAIVSIFTGLTVTLGIDTKSTVLLILSLFTIMLSFGTGRTTILQGVVLLVIFAVYLFTTIVP